MWSIIYRPGTEYSVHNHEPSLSPSAHPIHRQLSSEDKLMISMLDEAGIPTKNIRAFMRNSSDGLATQQDYRNHLKHTRRNITQGQSSIHALAQQLQDDGFSSKIEVDDDNRVTAILFAHPASLEYLKAYPDIMVLDCTYKTNKFNMPLLDIIGIDARGRSFCIGFAFLSGENEGDYTWALDNLLLLLREKGISSPSVVLTDRSLPCMRALQHCLPDTANILCAWHINKAITHYY